MLEKLKPTIKIDQLLKYGTDIEMKGRFKETLEYNHFTIEDQNRLKDIVLLLESNTNEIVEIFETSLQKLKDESTTTISKESISRYIQTFFYEERNLDYVDKIITFFEELHAKHYNIGKLAIVFNQLNFYLTTHLLSKKGLHPHKCIHLMESLQRSINIEQEILIEVFSEKLVEQVSEGIAHLMDKNAEIMYIKDLIQSLEEQNREIQNVTAATEEITASVTEVAKSATNVSEKTAQAVEKAENGKNEISDALDEIIHTRDTFDEIVKNFSNLIKYVSTIEDMVGLINGIADQTNLLALNASIEAARAGEHGKGFAVVASEVRKLAENTLSSLKQVQENVQNLRSFSTEVSDSINSTSVVIEKATTEAQEALPLLTEIVNVVEEINQDTMNIASVCEEQAAATDEIANRMASISNLSDVVRDLGRNTGAAVYSLSQSIDSFRQEVISYNNIKLSTKALLSLSKTDHILWKWRIYNMFLGLETIDPNDVTAHHNCRLGKWYFNENTKERCDQYASYRLLDEPHERVHGCAKRAAEAYLRNDIETAEKHLASLEDASKDVLKHINQLLNDLEQEKQQKLK
ncbi:MAG TPA: chemoreceptor protein [Bacillus bacterium]|nr:chemoreceptor protein [Bacillus sp. (in: firmicutes)]